ncbi:MULTISPECIES: CbtB domain-containing protein [Pseudonocardia]|uniref:Probable cobalt transporter subunit (CbtB) n=1 Tax=Pseudonocardia oroxyli TaxID=366584 RepID=A0A1G7XAF7_PSEOR|nr:MULTISPECIES: CbtB domain-containing protein [Pseudonocardia]MCF7549455.1 CbtB-domain containing protein [Pseudonocardia sp. WMMC193]SDG81202.1 Probable cobalt transporter subunit (CbtB) [Pseudonocardia oroxyli]
MAQGATLPSSSVSLGVVPLRELAPWAVFAGVILLALLYLVGMDQGATSVFSGEMIHEFVHDGRHLLGFPCH